MFEGLRNAFKRVKPTKIQGYIQLHGLEDFWMKECDEEDRKRVREHIETMGDKSPLSIEDLETRRILYAVVSKVTLLQLFADVFQEPEKADYCRREAFLEAERTLSVENLHFFYMKEWQRLKKALKDDENLVEEYISVLERDCRIHQQLLAIDAYRNVSYPAFKELALMYERQGLIDKAIYVTKLAIQEEVNEDTCFMRRLKRLEKKMNETAT